MKNQLILDLENRHMPVRKVHPVFRPGDTIRVHYKVEEMTKDAGAEKKFRLQAFEGVCLRFKKGTMGSSFTVRKIGAGSIGIERVFPLHSPYVDSVELVSGGRVRRARLYYLRKLSGKSARIRSRRIPAGTQLRTIDAGAAAAQGGSPPRDGVQE